MSLDWNIEKVKDWRALHEDEVEATITDAVIFMTLPVGLSSIREDNLDEWVFRAEVQRRLFGPVLRRGDGTEVALTREHLARRVGLSTNATQRTRAAWWSRLRQNVETVLARGARP